MGDPIAAAPLDGERQAPEILLQSGDLDKAVVDTEQKKASQYARSLIEASLDPLVTISAEGKITDVNEASVKVTGMPREKLIGTDFSDYFTEPEKAREGYKRVFSLGSVTDYPLTIRHRDGRLTDVLYNASVYKDSLGDVLGVFAAARDITDRKHAEHALERAKEVAENASRELEAFSYSVAHDLRAPLRSIDGFSQALLEDYADKLDADGKDYLRLSRESAQQMARLIEDLLKLARLTQVELRRERVDLSAMARDKALRLRTAQPERRVRFEIADGMIAEGDRGLLDIALENLLDNAWKFTRNRDQANISFGRDQQAGREVYVIRDNGAGFNMAYSAKLFGVFQRLHAASEFDGTGIGLATVQRIVRRHGGRIWAESAVDRGATFFFTLSAEQ